MLTLALALWPVANGWAAQDATAQPAAAASAGAAAEQPRNARERRRAARGEPAQSRSAQSSAAETAAPTAAGAKGAESELVCKTIKTTGSNVGRRVCGTAEQWAAQSKKTTDAAEDHMRQVRSHGAVISTTPGPASAP
jgi:hypothetical protein